QEEMEIALTVVSKSEPGYLRATVFTAFDLGQWESRAPTRGTQITATAKLPAGLPPLRKDEKLYAYPLLDEEDSSEWRCLECWLEGDGRSPALTPLGTTHLKTTGEQVGIMPFGLFLLYDIKESLPYTACLPEQSATFSMNSSVRQRLLSVPNPYHHSLETIAQNLFTDSQSPQEKIRAVETYFQDNYQYRLGIEIPDNEDPLLYFLREKPPAHCEYFASAAALLLRMGGVPTRYVTGLVTSEWNASGGYWVARNRDAHAWVEAYDEEIQGWVIVEATPSEGVPTLHESESPWWESLRDDWRKFQVFVAQGRWNRAGWLLLSSWLLVVFVLLVAGFALYLTLRIRSRWPRKKAPIEELSPEILEMRKLLERMDQQLQHHGLLRHGGETLHQFAARISRWTQWKQTKKSKAETAGLTSSQFADRAANWYRDYACSVYTGQWNAETRQKLLNHLPILPTE
ncbi:MAG: transglutaminase domain-containing protein, partial [Planctomycetaceae bacterium]|nr:transglutaminase domain-containing protein [Planctomycetaceae bacterium]